MVFCFDSHHLPVSGHGIFSIASFTQMRISPLGILNTRHFSCRMKIQHSQFSKIWDLQRTHFLKNMSKSIHPDVTKFMNPALPRSENQVQLQNSVVIFHLCLLLLLHLLIMTFSCSLYSSFTFYFSQLKITCNDGRLPYISREFIRFRSPNPSGSKSFSV